MKSPNITKYSKKFISDNKPLAAIVCGFPNGGTTLISEILRTHPELDSGFEGGFLLSEQPSKFLDLTQLAKECFGEISLNFKQETNQLTHVK
jgi:hypothetical protein